MLINVDIIKLRKTSRHFIFVQKSFKKW